MALIKDKFINRGDGHTGVVTLDPKGNEKPLAVGPGAEVWLSEDEQVLTANAPRDPADNPLANGTLELLGSASEARNMRPLRPDPAPPIEDEPVAPVAAETGAAPLPEGDAVEGTRPVGEEVGTPEAAKARTRTRSKAA